MELSENALKQFNDLYSFKGECLEDSYKRVAKEFATTDEEFQIAYDLLLNNIWRPNTPVWLNAGTDHKIFSACFTVNLDDSMDSIYDVANVSRKIFQFGSGVGIPIGNIREDGAFIYEGNKDKVPEGKTSGPITFMKLYDSVGETTKSGGRVRRAAILCTMPVWHPDIIDFINCKAEDGKLSNMNISILITDLFMKSLKDGTPFSLYTPYDGSKIGEIDPQVIWDKLVEMSRKTADPGIIFIDTVNKWNPLIAKYLIETMNPCVVGDTLIATADGRKELTSLTLNDKILSYNEETGEIEYDEMIGLLKTKEDADIIELEIKENDEIFYLKCTSDHKIYTKNRGYVEAKNLDEKDDIYINRP